MDFKLIESSSGSEVGAGDFMRSFRDDEYVLLYPMPPKHSGSEGRVVVLAAGETDRSKCREFYPSVFGCKFVAEGGGEKS
jgi:hypothetical protein